MGPTGTSWATATEAEAMRHGSSWLKCIFAAVQVMIQGAGVSLVREIIAIRDSAGELHIKPTSVRYIYIYIYVKPLNLL